MIGSVRHHDVNVRLLQALEAALQPFHDMLFGKAPVAQLNISDPSVQWELNPRNATQRLGRYTAEI